MRLSARQPGASQTFVAPYYISTDLTLLVPLSKQNFLHAPAPPWLPATVHTRATSANADGRRTAAGVSSAPGRLAIR